MLIVHIGSMNPQKIAAVKEEFGEWGIEAQFEFSDACSGVGEQPYGLDRITEGALSRARAAACFTSESTTNKIGIGLESGVIVSPHISTSLLNVIVCAFHYIESAGSPDLVYQDILGISSTFQIPHDMRMKMHEEGLDLSQAARAAGYTNHPKIGTAGGIVSILTNGRVTRKDQLREAVRSALISFNTPL